MTKKRMKSNGIREIDGWIKDLNSRITHQEEEITRLQLQTQSLQKLTLELVYTLDMMQNNIELNNSLMQMHNHLFLRTYAKP